MGHRELVNWAQGASVGRVAIEGSGGYGRAAALALGEAGAEVVDVPPQMTAAARRSQRTAAKSDPLDALLVARIGARDSDLPPSRPGGTLEELRWLAGYRRELVKSRTAHINRLHADLTQIRCGYHRTGAALTSAKGLQRVARLLAGDSAAPARVARGRLRQIRELNRQIADLAAEISELVSANGTTLTKIRGIGTIGAADILTEVGDPARFATKARFAMANGTAPLQASSGRTVRHRLNRGGNRQLNRAIHTAALTQIAQPNSEGRRLYQQHLDRGKTKREAIRALKRRISDRIWTHLQTDLRKHKSHPRLDIEAHTRRTGLPNAGRSTNTTARSPSDHNRCPQPPQTGLAARQRTCTRNGPPPSSSTLSTSTSPNPTSNSHMRVGSHSTGILPIRLSKQRRFWGIPRVQPRTLTLLTPTSNDAPMFVKPRFQRGAAGSARRAGGRGGGPARGLRSGWWRRRGLRLRR